MVNIARLHKSVHDKSARELLEICKIIKKQEKG